MIDFLKATNEHACENCGRLIQVGEYRIIETDDLGIEYHSHGCCVGDMRTLTADVQQIRNAAGSE